MERACATAGSVILSMVPTRGSSRGTRGLVGAAWSYQRLALELQHVTMILGHSIVDPRGKPKTRETGVEQVTFTLRTGCFCVSTRGKNTGEPAGTTHNHIYTYLVIVFQSCWVAMPISLFCAASKLLGRYAHLAVMCGILATWGCAPTRRHQYFVCCCRDAVSA